MGLLLALWVTALVLPTGAATWFDGVPFSSVPEAVAFAALVPLLVSRAHRRLLAGAFRRGHPRYREIALGTAVAALTFKVLLLAAPPAGFVACYQSTLTPPPSGPCERSFENPFNRFAATRIDRTIDFGPTNWNLTFFNSLRFNFYPWERGHPRRDRLPFSATWQGAVDAGSAPVTVTYVGEGSVLLDNRVLVPLPRTYAALQSLPIPLSPGRHTFRARYTFDDGSRTGDVERFGPYATFRVIVDGSPAAAFHPAPPALWVRVGAIVTDALCFGALGLLLYWYVRLLRRPAVETLTLTAPGGVLAAIAWRRLADATLATGISWVLMAAVLRRNRSTTLLLAYAIIVVAAVLTLSSGYGSIGVVAYRSAGNDWLTYESHARAVLESGLEGGEQVYYNQRLFRYVRFAEHVVLGDGDFLIDLCGWIALHWSLLWAISALTAIGPRPRPTNPAVWLPAMLGLALADWYPVLTFITRSLSEHITWIFLAAGFASVASPRVGRWPVGAAFLGCALITRPNQGPALALALAGLLLLHAPLKPTRVRPSLYVFIAISLLPLAHNLYYGHQLVLFTTTVTSPAALALSPSALMRAAHDPGVRNLIGSQLRAVLCLPPSIEFGWNRENITLHGLQVLWIVALWRSVRTSNPAVAAVLLLVPTLFLGVHLVYDALTYYPRHVLAGYFAMSLVTTAAGSVSSIRRTRAVPQAT